MNFKKTLSIFTIFISIIFTTSSFADDYIEENIPVSSSDLAINSSTTNVPKINAKHSVVLDRSSKTILFGKNENEKCKMASTTKIMTAIVVIENCTDYNVTTTISKKSARYRRFEIRITYR